MQRLKQNWKVVAYFAGMAALTLTPFKEVFVAAGIGGLVWLFVWLVRNGEPGRDPTPFDDGGVYGIGARSPSALQSMRRNSELM